MPEPQRSARCLTAALTSMVCGCNALWGIDDLHQEPSNVAAASGGEAVGGQSGSSTGASGDGGAGATVDCSGTFGRASEVLYDPEGIPQSPAIVPGELELFYAVEVAGDGGGSSWQIRRAERATVVDPFPSGATDSVLTSICSFGDPPTLDVSADGLRAYVACAPGLALSRPAATLAVRSAVNQPFAEARNIVARSTGPSPAISPDELELFSSGWQMGTGPWVALRADRDAPFGAPKAIAGSENFDEILTTPCLAADGLTLFGYASGLVVTTRSGSASPFGALAHVDVGAFSLAGSPEVSHDCRALYFVGVTGNTGGRVYVVRR